MTPAGATSLGAWLQALAADLPGALIPPQAQAGLLGLAARFPAGAAAGWILECRLGSAAGQVDLLLRATRPADTLALVDAGERTEAVPGPSAAPSIWPRLRAACEAWARPGGALHGRLGDVWIELDLEGPAAAATPSFFVGPRGGIGPAAQRRCGWLTASVLPLLLGEDAARRVARTIHRCAAALPRGARIFHVGAMLSRRAEVVRLCVNRLGPPQVPAYLWRVGWPGSMGAVEAVLGGVTPHVDRVALALDVAESVRPRLGLECYAPMDRGALPDWSGVLGWLQERGLCLPPEREALLAWPGLRREGDLPSWPEELRLVSTFVEHRRRSAVLRGLNHVKLTMDPDHPPTAKAYLWMRGYWGPGWRIRTSLDGRHPQPEGEDRSAGCPDPGRAAGRECLVRR